MPNRNRFVSPEIKRLDLSEGDWVEIKARLSYREEQELAGAMIRATRGDGDEREVSVNVARYAILKLITYLQEWSFRDEQDKPVPLSPSAIENLDPDTAEEIDEAINAHVEALKASKATPATKGSGKK